MAGLLLDAHADVDKGSSPLVHAAERGHVEVISLLVDRGVDLDGVKKSWQTEKTALYHAVGKDKRMVRLLLDARADVNKGSSPLLSAIHEGTEGWVPQGPMDEQLDLVRLLFDSGAKRTYEAEEKVKKALQQLDAGPPSYARCVKQPDPQGRERLEECLALLQSGGSNVILNLSVVEATPGSSWSISVYSLSGDCVACITVDPMSTTVPQLQAGIAEYTSVASQHQRWVLGGRELNLEAALASTTIGSFLAAGLTVACQ